MAEITDFDKTRIIKLEVAYNTRDLGGFKVIGDGMVRRGLVFRSDELNCLTDKDAARLDTFGIKTVVDFRSGGEIMRSKDWRPRGGAEYRLRGFGGRFGRRQRPLRTEVDGKRQPPAG